MRVSKWCVYEILSNLLCLEMFHNKILEKIECSNFLLLKIFWPLKISDVKEFSFVVFLIFLRLKISPLLLVKTKVEDVVKVEGVT